MEILIAILNMAWLYLCLAPALIISAVILIKWAKNSSAPVQSNKQLQKSVDSLQESIDYLRICIKYQLLDLEATRRENKYLRKLLEEKDS